MRIIKKEGYMLELEQVSPTLATKKVIKQFKDSKKIISNVDANYLVSRVGIDLCLLMNEVDKVISYLGERTEVKKEDIDLLCIQNLESKVFDLIKFICNKKFDAAMKSYNNLIIHKEPIVKILFMISRQYMMMYEALRLSQSGYTNAQIMPLIDAKQEFVVREVLTQAKGYGLNKLVCILKDCLDMDMQIKNGSTSIDMFIVKLMKAY